MHTVLYHRKILDFKEPIGTYWPKFAQNGKEHITLEMLLAHQVISLCMLALWANDDCNILGHLERNVQLSN